MSQSFSQYVMVAGAFLVCSACGGGSQSEVANDDVGENPQIDPIVIVPTLEPIEVKTEDLIASDDFVFSASTDLIFKVEISDLLYSRAYINICHLNELGEINYQNCVVNAPLKNGVMQASIPLGNDVQTLSMAIWTYDADADARVSSWSRDDGMSWVVAQ